MEDGSLHDEEEFDPPPEDPREEAKHLFGLLKRGGLSDDDAFNAGFRIQRLVDSHQISFEDLEPGMDQDKFETIYLDSVPGKREYYQVYRRDHHLDR